MRGKICERLLTQRRSARSAGLDHLGIQVWAQRGGNNYAAVRLLVIFHDGHPRTANGKAAAVQCVDGLGLLTGTEPDGGPPRLESLEI